MGSLTGVIFNIVRGSFVDGYGLRTTVFLKGCPLRCLWCCNPEGQKFEPELKFVAANCTLCGKCINVCPTGAIAKNVATPDKKLAIDRNKCTMCGKCVDVCFENALDIIGKRMTVDEVMAIVKKDEMYYQQSGGGVTIGGGEPTAQPEFTLALIRECKKNYIHTAVDTCGYTVTDEGFAVLAEADLLLFDIKGLDPAEHKKNTGVSNEVIIDNLRRLNSLKKSIIIRIPLIPGHNDSEDNIEKTAAFLSSLKQVERVDIIPYHKYGKIKYGEIGMIYPLEHLANDFITPEAQEKAIQTFARHGLRAQIGG
ncbi:MAG: glycyl-radical enzyme activating protein [Firmicutes bacterium]|nr:glycyl-radical enzyme activating protein [Bacillota bacterium]